MFCVWNDIKGHTTPNTQDKASEVQYSMQVKVQTYTSKKRNVMSKGSRYNILPLQVVLLQSFYLLAILGDQIVTWLAPNEVIDERFLFTVNSSLSFVPAPTFANLLGTIYPSTPSSFSSSIPFSMNKKYLSNCLYADVLELLYYQ